MHSQVNYDNFCRTKKHTFVWKRSNCIPWNGHVFLPCPVEDWKANIGVLLRSGHAQLNPSQARAGPGCTGGYCWTEALLEVTDKFPEISEAWPLQGIPQSFSVTRLITSISKTKLNVALKFKKKPKKLMLQSVSF